MKVFVALVLCLASCVSARDIFANRPETADKRALRVPLLVGLPRVWGSLLETGLSNLCTFAAGADEAKITADVSIGPDQGSPGMDIGSLKRALQDLMAEKRRVKRALHTLAEEQAFYTELLLRTDSLGDLIGDLCVHFNDLLFYVLNTTLKADVNVDIQ